MKYDWPVTKIENEGWTEKEKKVVSPGAKEIIF